ncbi:recombinase family protein [Phenylobacterium sp.]|uniref:recombinase family protein n=1 Tax=Phenylobacterium sp. TaxID=1871053 RepID=UPI0035B21AE8
MARALEAPLRSLFLSPEQRLDLQLDELGLAGCERLLTDQASGRQDRPALIATRSHPRQGETLVVWKFDRLGRLARHLVERVAELERQECTSRASPTAATLRLRRTGSSSTTWQS